MSPLRKAINRAFPTTNAVLPTDPDNRKSIGFQAPRSLARHLSLLALVRGRTMSALIRDAIHEWLGPNSDPEQLADAIADRAYQTWEDQLQEARENGKRGWNTLNQVDDKFEQFVYQLELMLRRRHVDEPDIERIVNRVQTLRSNHVGEETVE